MKFDFAIGNPPYQEKAPGESTSEKPIYHYFLDAAFDIADKVELITPARFLFNAGSTPKSWNRKMLLDTHFKVLHYEENGKKVFPSTDIKGGVVVSYRDNVKEFGAIETFLAYPELATIFKKVVNNSSFEPFSEIVISRTSYRLTDMLHRDYPNAINQLSNGHAYDMGTNIFDRLPEVFYERKPKDDREYIRILGRTGNQRVYRWILKDYVNTVSNLNKFKVIMAKSNGDGKFGETFADFVIGEPEVGNTETFLSIGAFDTLQEAEYCEKYIKTKFARCMLGILKTTQDIIPEKWKFVPLQDFTDDSDILWIKSIKKIDEQLYKKYNLSDEEIYFIETKVKEME